MNNKREGPTEKEIGESKKQGRQNTKSKQKKVRKLRSKCSKKNTPIDSNKVRPKTIFEVKHDKFGECIAGRPSK